MDMIDSWTVDGERFGHDGWTFRVVLTYDHGANPDEYDCYSDADKAAWKRDDWCFVDVTVTPVDSMGRVWEQEADHLGGVEWGRLDKVAITRESFDAHPLPGMITEVMGAVQEKSNNA